MYTRCCRCIIYTLSLHDGPAVADAVMGSRVRVSMRGAACAAARSSVGGLRMKRGAPRRRCSPTRARLRLLSSLSLSRSRPRPSLTPSRSPVLRAARTLGLLAHSRPVYAALVARDFFNEVRRKSR